MELFLEMVEAGRAKSDIPAMTKVHFQNGAQKNTVLNISFISLDPVLHGTQFSTVRFLPWVQLDGAKHDSIFHQVSVSCLQLGPILLLFSNINS